MPLVIILVLIFGAVTAAVFVVVPPMHDRAADVLERQEQEQVAAKARAERRIEHMWRGIGDGR